jgi:hypothetical protein
MVAANLGEGESLWSWHDLVPWLWGHPSSAGPNAARDDAEPADVGGGGGGGGGDSAPRTSGGEVATAGAQPPQEESSNSVSRIEWEVVNTSPVNIRLEKNFDSKIIGARPPGWVLVGQKEGDWLSLETSPGDKSSGYILTILGPSDVLRKRRVVYSLLRHSSCSASDVFPISIAGICASAARNLGWSIEKAADAAAWCLNVKGCYVRDPHTNELNVICSSSSYPLEMEMDLQVTHTTTGPSTLPWGTVHRARNFAATTTTTGLISKLPAMTAALPTTTTLPLTTRHSWPYPSIFCWLVTASSGSELSLVRKQHAERWGIFQCEEHMTLSDTILEIGSGESTTPIGDITCEKGGWGSWVNTKIFVNAWDAIIKDGRYQRHDWVVKVDPDTVFFPERLKAHLNGAQGGQMWWLKNVAGYTTIGALEVFSRAAVEVYGRRRMEPQCQNHIIGSAEDQYICECMSSFGAYPWKDFNALQHMKGNQCFDSSKIAFHPFKDVSLYESCVHQAMR